MQCMYARQGKTGQCRMATGHRPKQAAKPGSSFHPIGGQINCLSDPPRRQNIGGYIGGEIEEEPLNAALLLSNLPGFAPQAVNERRKPSEKVEYAVAGPIGRRSCALS